MSVIDDAIALIERDELVRFALEICNIDSAVGHEGEVGEHLYNWMRQQGFVARKIGLLSDRFNVLATLPGTGGGGPNLIGGWTVNYLSCHGGSGVLSFEY
jgi:hypothetical protein